MDSLSASKFSVLSESLSVNDPNHVDRAWLPAEFVHIAPPVTAAFTLLMGSLE